MSPEEFNRVFRAQLPMISAYLARRVPFSDVEDLASDLFEVAWSKKAQIPEGFELPWLYKTARYLVSNFHRKQSGRNNILARLAEPVAAPSAESIALADIELSDAFAGLNSVEREIISLWALEGLSNAEIAKVIEVSENAAAIKLTRAKQKLKNLLKPEKMQ
jgi:RNA polymerase sigma-70 factor (ECF subfamily)